MVMSDDTMNDCKITTKFNHNFRKVGELVECPMEGAAQVGR